MPIIRRALVGIPVVLCVVLTCHSPSYAQSSPAQQTSSPNPNEVFASQKKFAAELLNHQHYMEALPLFEELARSHANDPDILFGWGVCLGAHAETLPDEGSRRKERVQARELLVRAKQLGNNSPLLLNLLEITPEDGSTLLHGSNSEADKALQAGEAAFARNDYEEAINNYTRVFELDPKNYSAVLFIGDSYFALKNFPKATEWYERAIQINPDAETAYRYEADMLTRNGDMEKARTLSIRAVVANPYSQIPWRGLLGWANANHVKLTPMRINTHNDISKDGSKSVTITLDPTSPHGFDSVWIIYAGVRLRWRQEEFKKRYPEESQYRHTLAEETEALSVAAGLLAKEKKSVIEADPDLALLKKLADAKLLEPYVLLSAADNDIARDYAGYREHNRAQLEEYLSRFIVPVVPGKP